MLLAFAIIVVWEKFSNAEASVVQEAGAATTIYRLSQGMGERPAADIRAAITNYLEALLAAVIFSELLTIIAIDWPFTGPVRVESTALEYVLADFRAAEAAH